MHSEAQLALLESDNLLTVLIMSSVTALRLTLSPSDLRTKAASFNIDFPRENMMQPSELEIKYTNIQLEKL